MINSNLLIEAPDRLILSDVAKEPLELAEKIPVACRELLQLVVTKLFPDSSL